MHLYVDSYRPNDQMRAEELNSVLVESMRLPFISRIFLFASNKEGLSFPAHEKIAVVHLDERLTFAHWLEEAGRRSTGSVAILANADILLTEEVVNLCDIFSREPRSFVALSRYEETCRGPELHQAPHWSQDLWAILPDAICADTGLLRLSRFPLGIPGCDNSIAFLAHCFGFTLHNPCRQVMILHRHNHGFREYTLQDRLFGAYCFVHPSGVLCAPSELSFEILSMGSQPYQSLQLTHLKEHEYRMLAYVRFDTGHT